MARILFGFVAEAMPLWLREMCQPPVYANGHLTQERGPKIMMHYSGRPADIEVAARFASYGMVRHQTSLSLITRKHSV